MKNMLPWINLILDTKKDQSREIIYNIILYSSDFTFYDFYNKIYYFEKSMYYNLQHVIVLNINIYCLENIEINIKNIYIYTYLYTSITLLVILFII